MVIFHSYVKLPEGNQEIRSNWSGSAEWSEERRWSCATWQTHWENGAFLVWLDASSLGI
jgi:hypothetical protein